MSLQRAASSSSKKMKSDHCHSLDASTETINSMLATVPSFDSALQAHVATSLGDLFVSRESESGLCSTAPPTLSTEASILRSADVVRHMAAQDSKLATRKKLESTALSILKSQRNVECAEVGPFLSVSLVIAGLAITSTPSTRVSSRSAASAFASALDTTLKDRVKLLENCVFQELVSALIKLAASCAAASPSKSSASQPVPSATRQTEAAVDLHIVTTLARSLQVTICHTHEMAEATAKVVRCALLLDDTNKGDCVNVAVDQERSMDVSAGLSLASQVGPWQALDPVELVQVAVLYSQWYGAERICQSIASRGDENVWSLLANRAVHTLIDAALSSRSYRQADAFATQFFNVGGQSRFLEARFLHACDTISKVIQKRALPVIERQVERIDQAVKRITDIHDNAVDGVSVVSSSDTAATSVLTASSDIREFAIRRLEESLDIDAAHRLASIWNMTYSCNEKDVEAALATRRKKFLQWDDLLPDQPIPELLSTAESLHAAFANFGQQNVYGFDVEWGDDGSGAALLQIATTDSVVLVDIPALSKSEEGTDALERTVGKLFAASSATVVGFGCRQDLLKLRSSPCARQKHWLVECNAVRDLQPLVDNSSRRAAMGLSRCCEQYLSKPLDKSEQCSDWLQRPLNQNQRVYAALDAYVCAIIFSEHFNR